jgi:hypothetical protein
LDGLSGRFEFEPLAEKLGYLSQSGSAEAESALDDTGLTADIAGKVERRGLPLAERVHHLEALDGRVGRLQRLEASDRSDQLLQLAVAGLDDVVQIAVKEKAVIVAIEINLSMCRRAKILTVRSSLHAHISSLTRTGS